MSRESCSKDPAERAELRRLQRLARYALNEFGYQAVTVYLEDGKPCWATRYDGDPSAIVGVYSKVPSVYKLAADVRATMCVHAVE